jgi:hypothetical protein
MSTAQASRTDPPTRVLAVADWSVDPEVVAQTLLAESEREPTVFGFLVPSRLPGLDWIGDPYASRSCAERLLRELERLMRLHGLAVDGASVGDPERVSVIRASAESWRADRILLFERSRREPRNPFSLARRVRRNAGYVVERIAVPHPSASDRGFMRRAPRCVATGAAAA